MSTKLTASKHAPDANSDLHRTKKKLDLQVKKFNLQVADFMALARSISQSVSDTSSITAKINLTKSTKPVADGRIKLAINTPPLSARLIQVVRLVSLGCTNTEIGLILGISQSTADNHRTRAMGVLHAHNSIVLTRLALKYGYTSLGEQLTPAEKRKGHVTQDGWN